MPNVLHFAIRISLLATVCLVPLASGRCDEPGDSGKFSALLQQLSSDDFDSRVKASAELRELSATQIVALARLVPQVESPETTTRILRELENRYTSEDSEQQKAASDALEELANDSRLIISEAARRSLKLHWEKRINVALQMLRDNGATVKDGHFTPGMTFGWMPPRSGPQQTIQVILGEQWKGKADAIQIFRRLAPLLGPVRGRNGLTLYLLDGHPLSEEQLASLREVVGTNRIVERSRVALGILKDLHHNENVLIGDVSEGGSADAAGLEVGDLIEAIENPKKEGTKGDAREAIEKAEVLRDFDDLVERLRSYREGDVVKLRVIRDYRSQLDEQQKEFLIEFDQLVEDIVAGSRTEKELKAATDSFRSQLTADPRILALFDSLVARLKNEESQFQGIDISQVTYYVRSQMRPAKPPEMKRELVDVELFGWEKLKAR